MLTEVNDQMVLRVQPGWRAEWVPVAASAGEQGSVVGKVSESGCDSLTFDDAIEALRRAPVA